MLDRLSVVKQCDCYAYQFIVPSANTTVIAAELYNNEQIMMPQIFQLMTWPNWPMDPASTCVDAENYQQADGPTSVSSVAGAVPSKGTPRKQWQSSS